MSQAPPTFSRNPEAVCGNCPYWHYTTRLITPTINALGMSECRKGPLHIARLPDDWCGEHPELFKEIPHAE